MSSQQIVAVRGSVKSGCGRSHWRNLRKQIANTDKQAFILDSTLASVAFNGVITFWELETSQKADLQMIGDRDFLPILAFSPDGTKLASVDAKAIMFFEPGSGISVSTQMPDHQVRLTDVTTGRELATLNEINAGTHPSSSMAFSPDGKTVAFAGQGKIHLWNTEAGNTLDISLVDENDAPQKLNNPNGNGDLKIPPDIIFRQMPDISALVFSPDGKKLVSGTMGGKVQMWDAETGVELAPFLQGQDMEKATKRDPVKMSVKVSYRDAITALAFSPNSALLAIGSYKRIRVLGSHKQSRLREVSHGVETLVFSPDSIVLVAGRRNGGIELWDLATGNKLTILDGHTAPVGTLVFSPDKKTLVSTGKDGTILVWDWDEVLKNSSEADKK